MKLGKLGRKSGGKGPKQATANHAIGMRLNSVFVKTALLMALCTLLVGGMLEYMSITHAHDEMREAVSARGNGVSEMLAHNSARATDTFNSPELAERLSNAHEAAKDDMLAGVIIGESGLVMARDGDESHMDLLIKLAKAALESKGPAHTLDEMNIAKVIYRPNTNIPIGAVATAWTADEEIARLDAKIIDSLILGAGLLFAAILGATAVLWYVLSRPLMRLNAAMSEIATGELHTTVPSRSRGDEIGSFARGLEEFRTSLIAAEDTNRDALFKGSALRAASANLMLADADFNITYMNPALNTFMHELADEIRQRVPDFDPNTILGTSMDAFHKAPEGARTRLSDPKNLPFSTTIAMGNSYVSLKIAGITDENGEIIGYAVEWADQTEALRNTAIMQTLDAHQLRLEASPDGRITAANDTVGAALGVNTESLIGSDIKSLLSAETSKGDVSEIWSNLARGKGVFGTFRFDVAGNNCVVEGGLTPVTDPSGAIVSLLLLANDISASHAAAELARRDRKEREATQSRVVETLASALQELAEGNLMATISTDIPAEYEQLKTDFNKALKGLEGAMQEVVTSAKTIRLETDEIASAADDLSRRTETQAATLEQTVAALNHITESVSATANGAKRADQVVAEARTNAEESGAVVREAVDAMSEIERSSEQISKIIGVIDEIAFQTNLLALNAGVEAARAGDAGRGFAVVASEVRALAQRSSEAAQEINNLISESGQHVERGVTLVGDAGTALERIVTWIADIATLVTDISSSAAEQSSGLSEINTAMTQLDKVTQQNAAMFEETNAASHALTSGARALSDTVGHFKLGAFETVSSTSPARAKSSRAFKKKTSLKPESSAQSDISTKVSSPRPPQAKRETPHAKAKPSLPKVTRKSANHTPAKKAVGAFDRVENIPLDSGWEDF